MLIYGFKLVVIPFHEDHAAAQNSHQIPLAQDDLVANEQQENRRDQESNNKMDEKSQAPGGSTTNTQTGQQSSTYTSLSSYTIDLRKLDNWLETRIVDIEFLYGYYEPTLFILCESTMTWVGRYSVRKDTCNSVALSLNLTQKIHPIIWPVDKLPSDCLKCYAVPQPIGGIIIFAVNSLIYINQSVPCYAVSLNSMAKVNSAYPFTKNMEHVKCTLDMSQAAFIEPNRFIVSLKGGELYIITLLTDSESLRTVRDVHVEKGPSSAISSCLTKCGDQFLFIGSRLGNSVLLKYAKRAKSNAVSTSASNTDTKTEVPDTALDTTQTRVNAANSNGTSHHYSDEYEELDRLLELNEVKCQRNSSETLVTYAFDVCDILLNVAPCGHSIIGESVGDYSEFAGGSTFPNVDLVTSSGHTKNGAISIMQRSLRPESIVKFQIADIVDMWSVGNDEQVG